MKFIILFIILVAFSLEASNFENGRKAFIEKDYKKAVYFFKKSKKEFLNIEMQYMWAESEESLDRTDYMMAAYERILNLEDRNIETTFKLVDIYSLNGQKQEIKKIILNLDSSDYLPKYRSDIINLVGSNYVKLNHLSTRLTTEIGYDSDPNFTLYEENIKEYIQEQKQENLKDSMYAKTAINTSYIYNLDENKALYSKIDINIMNKGHWNNLFYDLKYIKITPEIGYKISNTALSFLVYGDYTYYLERDLVKTYGFVPKISTLIAKKYIFDFDIKYAQRIYIGKNMNMYDSNIYGLSSSLKYIFDRNYIIFDIEYLKNSAKYKNIYSNAPSFVDNQTISFYIDTMFRLNYNFVTNISYKIRLKYFDEYDLTDEKRKDRYYDLRVGISRNLSKVVKIFAKFNYDVNIIPEYVTDYDRLTTSIGLEYNF